MAEPASDHITTTPSQHGQPYDASDSDRSTAPWVKLTANSGEADIHDGHVTRDFADSPPWVQV